MVQSTYRNRRLTICHVKGHSKCNHKERGEQDDLHEGVEHTKQHDDVDSSERKFSNKNHEIQPAQEHGHHSNLPLPEGNALAISPVDSSKQNRIEIEAQLDKIILLNYIMILNNLGCLMKKPKHGYQDNQRCYHIDKRWLQSGIICKE